MKCDEKILKREMDQHNLVCLNLKEKCENCELDFLPNMLKRDGEEHDCIQALIFAREKLDIEELEIKNETGVNYDKINT